MSILTVIFSLFVTLLSGHQQSIATSHQQIDGSSGSRPGIVNPHRLESGGPIL